MSGEFRDHRSTGELDTQESEDRLWQAHLGNGDVKAREELIERYLPIAQRLARRFVSRGEPYEDLVQVASVALVGAVDRYNPERGVAFGGFATLTIVGELKKHFRDRGWAIRAPRRVQELSLRLTSATVEATQTLGHAPTVQQLGEILGVSVEEVIEAMVANQGYRTASLDAPSPTESKKTMEPPSLEAGFADVELRAALAPALANLNERERQIVSLRFEQNASQVEIAEIVGISQMQVSRILARVLSTLREYLGRSDDGLLT
ncbi:MAG: SigB/SigF/SigG family RNA polymerase sigma factor [Acidimicrobiales bacterium]